MRSLADDLRARTDDELANLVLLRPDLARPSPADLTSLAARSVTRASLTRVLDDLDTGSLQVLEAVAVLGSADGVSPVARLLGAPTDRVGPLLEQLWARALLWRWGRTRHVPRPVAEALGPYVAGLAPAGPGDPAGPPGQPDDLDTIERALLDRLTWGPPVGRLPEQGAAAVAARSLLAAGWLVPGADGEVVLPRPAALALRGGRLHRELALDAPPVPGREVPQEQVAGAAGGQAVHLLGLVEELIARWQTDPPRVLRSGGLAVRDLRTVSQGLEVEPELAAFVVELARDGGLVADDGLLDPAWVPTHDYDDWAGRPTVDRWITLVRAWLESTRAPHRVGARPVDVPGASGTVNALSDQASWPRLRLLRREILAELLDVPPGRLVDEAALVARMSWRHPLRPEGVTVEAVTATRQAAEWLGVTGRGALPEQVRPLLVAAGIRAPGTPAAEPEATDSSDSSDSPEAPDAPPALNHDLVATMLPRPVEHMLLQADLTAIVPGPLGPGLATLLRACAEPESRGGAFVYRFTPAGIRRGLDAGWSAPALLEALARAGATPVPQPLTYLVNDVARRHGVLRVGAVASYVRSDDPAALDTLVARRELAPAGLRRLAPTVAVSTAAPGVLLELLREAGGTPVLEGPDGMVVTAAEPAARAHRRALPPVQLAAPTLADARRLVAGLRAGQEVRDRQDAAARSRDDGPSVPAADPAVVLALVREAIARRGAVWIGLADGSGTTRRMLLHPSRIDGGRIHGYVDEQVVAGPRRPERGARAPRGDVRALSLHRISGAVLAD